MPETSVIIPTYNRLPFLKEAIASILQQSYTDFELILVDDGSTDDTKQFVARIDGIKYIFQKNRGPSAARNAGIAVAEGKFLTFLDSDDFWMPHKLKKQIDLMKKQREAVVCYTDEIWIRNGVRVNQKRRHRKYSGWIFEQCVPLCIVSPSSVLMRRKFFDEVGLFDENLPACEDYDLWLRTALLFPFHFIDEKLITKRGGHDDQLSAAWGLDCYRVQALQKLLENPSLSDKNRKLVVAKIIEKSRILEQGFRKRDKNTEADYYAGVADGISSQVR